MDVDSLPSEIFARVLKHSKYQTVVGLRKLSTRIDAVARRYGLGIRVPVMELTCGDFDVIKQIRSDLVLTVAAQTVQGLPSPLEVTNNDRRYEFTLDVDKTNSCEKYESMLEKIEVQRKLILNSYQLPINENLFTSLFNKRHCLRKINSLAIYSDFLGRDYSKENVRLLISSCPNIQNLVVYSRSSSFRIFCNKEVLGGRRWKNLYFFQSDLASVTEEMNTEFLFNVVKNCDQFCFLGKALLDVNDILNFIENRAQEVNLFTTQLWNLGTVSSQNSSRVEIVKRLDNIYGLKYKICNSIPTSFTISFARDAAVEIKFDVYQNLQYNPVRQ